MCCLPTTLDMYLLDWTEGTEVQAPDLRTAQPPDMRRQEGCGNCSQGGVTGGRAVAACSSSSVITTAFFPQGLSCRVKNSKSSFLFHLLLLC